MEAGRRTIMAVVSTPAPTPASADDDRPRTIAVPVAVATALFISEYAPARLRRALISMIDLMAAIPSIIVALFGLYFVMPRILGFDAWLSHHLGFIPVFHFRLANFPGNYASSTF